MGGFGGCWKTEIGGLLTTSTYITSRATSLRIGRRSGATRIWTESLYLSYPANDYTTMLPISSFQL